MNSASPVGPNAVLVEDTARKNEAGSTLMNDTVRISKNHTLSIRGFCLLSCSRGGWRDLSYFKFDSSALSSRDSLRR